MSGFLNGHKISVITLATLIGTLGGVFAFFEDLHDPYVTHDEMEVRLLKEELARLRAVTSTTPDQD